MAKPTRHGNGWRIRYPWIDGKRRSETFRTKREAQLAYAQRMLDLERYRLGLSIQCFTDKTYDDLVARWTEFSLPRKRSAKDDISIMRCHLIPQFGGLMLRAITAERIEKFQRRLSAERSPKTVHNILTLLRSQLNYACDLEWLPKVPKFRMPRIKINGHSFRYLKSDVEVRRFLRAAYQEGAKVHALFATAIYTGLRKGELAGL